MSSATPAPDLDRGPIQLHRAFRVTRAIPEGRAGATLILNGALLAQPGQFVMVWLPGIEERPFTLMDDDPASLTVASVGPFTHALCALRAGDRLWLRGPFGHGFALQGSRHLLVGGGSGTASLTLLAKRARSQGHELTAILGARTAKLLMLPWRFEELSCHVILATDDGSLGHHGTVLDAARCLFPSPQWGEGQGEGTPRLQSGEGWGEGDPWPWDLYACGPEPMLRALATQAVALHLPCWVSMERIMKCGIGLCGSCHCGAKLVCTDGPVFSAQEMLRALDTA